MSLHSIRIPVAVEYSEPLVAIGLSAVLREQVDFAVVDRSQALAEPCLVVVADYETGVRLARDSRPLSAHRQQLRILVVTTHDREHDVRVAMEAGVEGYLQLGCNVNELVGGVRLLAKGSRCLSTTAAQRIAEGMVRCALTVREQQVLNLVAQGESNKGVARQLGISVGTVKAHVKAIMGKLGVNTRTHATRLAVERGLTLADEAAPAAVITKLHTASHRQTAHSIDDRIRLSSLEAAAV